jgi:hypothetical protein
MGIDRRRLLLTTAAAFASGNGAYFSAVRPARGDVMTALAVANTAMAVMRAFAQQPGDGGLLDMMRAVDERLRVLSDQIAGVQTALAQIATQLGSLPEQIRALLDRQLVEDRIMRIHGAVERWRTISGRPTVTARQFSERDREDMLDVRRICTQARSELSGTPLGRSALAASLAPTSLALEVALEARVGEVSNIPSLLDSYDRWLNAIQNAELQASAARGLIDVNRRISEALNRIDREVVLHGAPSHPSSAPGTWQFGSSRQTCWRENRWLPYCEEVILPMNIEGYTRIRCGNSDRHISSPITMVVQISWSISAEMREADWRHWRFSFSEAAPIGTCADNQTTILRTLNFNQNFSSEGEIRRLAMARPEILSQRARLSNFPDLEIELNALEAERTFTTRALETAIAARQAVEAYRQTL